MKKISFAFSIIILSISLILIGLFISNTKHRKEEGKIAFSEHDGKYWQVWIMALDGSNKRKLTHSEVDKRSPDLSGDGRRIVYVTNDGELWVMTSNGNNQTQLPLNISTSEPKWCFQDGRIVFTSHRGISFLDDSDIWIVNSDGSNLKKVIRRPSIQFLPDISEDGKELVFVDVSEIVGHEIYKLNLETQDYTQLTENRSYDTKPLFTVDAATIVYSSDKDGSYNIWTMDKFGQNQKNLTNRASFDSSPVITKNGKTVFFLSDSSRNMEIWSINIDGTQLTQITNDGNDKQDITIYTP